MLADAQTVGGYISYLPKQYIFISFCWLPDKINEYIVQILSQMTDFLVILYDRKLFGQRHFTDQPSCAAEIRLVCSSKISLYYIRGSFFSH